jgi:hypothetical protein
MSTENGSAHALEGDRLRSSCSRLATPSASGAESDAWSVSANNGDYVVRLTSTASSSHDDERAMATILRHR